MSPPPAAESPAASPMNRLRRRPRPTSIASPSTPSASWRWTRSERADSGHPGAPLGQAPMAYWLWSRYLRFNPADPGWLNRDRFVLSCGHASAMLYALLHLAGYDLPLAELKRFRQLGSKTPGHPEHGLTPGVETTTGPLGQGLGNAVGMAIAERLLAARFNRDGFPLFDHRVWVVRQRRRHDGGGGVGGLVARRPPRPGQAQRPLRRQPHLDRRPHLAGLLRGRRAPLRGLRLARPAGRPTATTSPPSTPPSAPPATRPPGRR